MHILEKIIHNPDTVSTIFPDKSFFKNFTIKYIETINIISNVNPPKKKYFS